MKYYIKKEKEISEEKLKCCKDAEMNAILLRENPAILSLLASGATYTFLDLFFTVWPEERMRVRGWFSIPSIFMGALGLSIGTYRIYFPGRNNIACRILFSFLENYATILPYTMGEVFYIFCLNKKNWKWENNQYECAVTDPIFWRNFFPPMFMGATLLFTWSLLSPITKERLYAKGGLIKYTLKTFDFLSKVLLFSRIFQALILTLYPSISKPLTYEVGAIPGGVFGATLQIFKPQHQEKIYTGILYGMGILISYTLGKLTLLEYQGKDEANLERPDWSFYWALSKIISLSLFMLVGLRLTIKHSRRFVTERRTVQTFIEVDISEIQAKARAEAEEKARIEAEKRYGLLDVNLLSESENPPIIQAAVTQLPEGTKENISENAQEKPLLFSFTPTPVAFTPSPKPKRNCLEMCIVS